MRFGTVVVVAWTLTLVACSADKDAKFTVNGHELYLSCSGGPGPTVVFEAAIGGDHSLWPIADRIRTKAYACVSGR